MATARYSTSTAQLPDERSRIIGAGKVGAGSCAAERQRATEHPNLY
jgi:hypothetical protein